MSIVAITDVKVIDNPTHFFSPYQFEITFECISQLKEDLEFKMIYVGSPEDESYDQVLESILVGPVPVGVNKFVFQADPPKVELLPEENIYGVTVILLTCSYMDREFVRVGYYVNNEYLDERLREERAVAEKEAEENKKPLPPVQVDKLYRNILSEKPKVTRFTIDWDAPGSAEKQLQTQAVREVGQQASMEVM